MSYTNEYAGMNVTVICKSNPQSVYDNYYNEIEALIRMDGYTPETDIDNLISIAILSFDCDDNYGDYDAVNYCGGYGEEFTLHEFARYIDDCGGWSEFDYYA